MLLLEYLMVIGLLHRIYTGGSPQVGQRIVIYPLFQRFFYSSFFFIMFTLKKKLSGFGAECDFL